jgi:hypothetical protein
LKASLADVNKKAVSNKRQQECLRYSPLVERYLMTHKYETSNNVKGWKMILTQNTGANKETDRKFKKYNEIAKQCKRESDLLNEQYNAEVKKMRERQLANEKQCKEQQKALQQSQKEKLQNGGAAEYANMVTSIFNSEHLNNDHSGK